MTAVGKFLPRHHCYKKQSISQNQQKFIINIVYNNGFTDLDVCLLQNKNKSYTHSFQFYQEMACHQTSDGINFSLG